MHVNRTLRRLREEKIVLVERQVVIIQDMERLRELAQGLPEAAEMPAPLAAQNGFAAGALQDYSEAFCGGGVHPAASRGNSRASTRAQTMCPAVMWSCWISGVESDGARRHRSHSGDMSPPPSR